MELNQEKLNEFMGRAVVDIGATLHAGLVVIGEKLGLYKALANGDGPLTPAELAKKTGTTERYVRELNDCAERVDKCLAESVSEGSVWAGRCAEWDSRATPPTPIPRSRSG